MKFKNSFQPCLQHREFETDCHACLYITVHTLAGVLDLVIGDKYDETFDPQREKNEIPDHLKRFYNYQQSDEDRSGNYGPDGI